MLVTRSTQRASVQVHSTPFRSIASSAAHFCRNKAAGSDVDAFRLREEERDREQDARQNDETTSSGSSSQSDDPNAAEADAKRARVMTVRAEILGAAMQHVHELGWSREALEAGAQSLQLPSVVHGLFPRGGAELVEYFVGDCDQRLATYLEQDAQHILRPSDDTNDANRLRSEVEFVANACQYRLELLVPMLPKWSQAMGLRILPPNAPTALTQLMRMVDDICYHAGDRSTDVGFLSQLLFFSSSFSNYMT